MIPFNRPQPRKAADCKPLLVTLSLIDHPVDMLGDYFSGLQEDRLVARIQALINRQRPFDGGWCNNILNRVGHEGLTNEPFSLQQNVTEKVPLVIAVFDDGHGILERARIDQPTCAFACPFPNLKKPRPMEKHRDGAKSALVVAQQ